MVHSTRARRYKSRSKSIPKQNNNGNAVDILRTPRPKPKSNRGRNASSATSRTKTPKRSVKKKKERADTADIIIQDINENLRQEQVEQNVHSNDNTMIYSNLNPYVPFLWHIALLILCVLAMFTPLYRIPYDKTMVNDPNDDVAPSSSSASTANNKDGIDLDAINKIVAVQLRSKLDDIVNSKLNSIEKKIVLGLHDNVHKLIETNSVVAALTDTIKEFSSKDYVTNEKLMTRLDKNVRKTNLKLNAIAAQYEASTIKIQQKLQEIETKSAKENNQMEAKYNKFSKNQKHIVYEKTLKEELEKTHNSLMKYTKEEIARVVKERESILKNEVNSMETNILTTVNTYQKGYEKKLEGILSNISSKSKRVGNNIKDTEAMKATILKDVETLIKQNIDALNQKISLLLPKDTAEEMNKNIDKNEKEILDLSQSINSIEKMVEKSNDSIKKQCNADMLNLKKNMKTSMSTLESKVTKTLRDEIGKSIHSEARNIKNSITEKLKKSNEECKRIAMQNYDDITSKQIPKLDSDIKRSIDDIKTTYRKDILKNTKALKKEISQKFDNNNDNVISNNNNNNNVKSVWSSLLFSSSSNNNDLSVKSVKSMIHHAIETSFADRTGLVDYAIEVAGGQIVRALTSKTYYHSYSARISGHVVPEQIIRPNMKLGHCWPIDGSSGYVAVKLHPYRQVIPTSVTLEHVSKHIAHDIRSAPNNFEIWSYDTEKDENPRKLFESAYDIDSSDTSVQNFKFDNNLVSPIIQLRVLSNHGHPIHTCVYRFRVHGTLMDGGADEDVLMD